VVAGQARAARRAAALLAASLGLGAAGTLASDAHTDGVGIADRSVLRIIVRTPTGAAMGSGFVINDQHMLVTNRHVLEDATGIVVLEPAGRRNRPREAHLVAADDDRDLAVLVVPGVERAPLVLRTDPPVKGERAVALGYPGLGDRSDDMLGDADFTESTRTAGEVSRVIEEPWRADRRPLDMVQHTASTSPGSSGGPLLDGCGRVIGVNTRIVDPRLADGINFASSVEELAAFLDEQGIAYRSAAGDCLAATLPVAAATLLPADGDGGTAKVVIVAGIAAALLALLFWHYRRSLRAAPLPPAEPAPSGEATLSAAGERPTGFVVVARPQPPRCFTLHGRTADGRRFRREVRESDLRRGGILIGRDRHSAHVFVPDPEVSRRHARLAITDGRLTIEDLGSTNGTYLGRGPAIAAHLPIPIEPDASIRLAKCTIRLSAASHPSG
jgi:Trypsin-like peptidase domain/FHA domain